MALRSEHAVPLGEHIWAANRQLVLQMVPFEGKLTRADRDRENSPNWADLGVIEGITSMNCLGKDGGKIRVYSRASLGVRLETLQLWMAGVAPRLTAEYGFGQQSLTPKRNEALPVQILWMQ